MRLDGLTGVVLSVVVSVISTVGLVKYVPSLTASHQDFVVLDVIRLNNSFRTTAAPIIQGMGDAASSATAAELTIAGRRTHEVIRLVADGRPVLLAQAVIGNSRYEDITAEVIERLGLEPGSAVPYAEVEKALSDAEKAGRPQPIQNPGWAKSLVP